MSISCLYFFFYSSNFRMLIPMDFYFSYFSELIINLISGFLLNDTPF